MAFSLQQSPSNGIAAAATSSALTVAKPSLGQLLIASCGMAWATTAPVLSIADNSSGGAAWTLINTAPTTSNGALRWWYKVANATDVANLTTITFSWTNGSTTGGGCCSLDEYHGFVGTPTLDLNPTALATASVTTVTITGAVPAQATELALSVIQGNNGLGATTGTNTYSPNAGTNTTTWTTTTSTAGNGNTAKRNWAAPAAAPATSSKFVQTWTSSTTVEAVGATFYDFAPAPSNPGFFALFASVSTMVALAAVTVVLGAGSTYTSMTQAQFNTLASWGVGAIIVGSSSGQGGSWPYGFGGSVPFNSSSSNTYQNQLAAAAVLAHNAGIKVYLGIYIQNYEWGTANTTNPAPCLGNWDPAFTDANGNGWGTQTTAGSWNKMAFDYGCAVAQMNLDGMFWDTEGGGIGVGTSPGSDFVTWCWCNHNNGYGSSSSLAQQNGWAQTAGANMMAAINAGFQSLGGNARISGNQVPIITYQSTVAGYPQLLNGYMDKYYTFTGATTTVTGLGTVSYHTAIGASTWTAFLTGVASQTTGPIVLGDSLFYGYQFVTSGGPYSADSDGGWARALTDDRNSLAALSLGSNVFISPFIWPYDNTAGNGGSGIWSQATWNQAIGPILAGCEGDTYFIFQYTPLVSGGTLVTNYADNTYNGSPNINYTPLT